MAHRLSIHRNSINYGRLLKNLIRMLEASCSHSFYEVIPKGVQVWLPVEQRGVYPDISIIAGEPLFHNGHANKLTNPCLVVEILPERTPFYNPMASTLIDRSRLFHRCRSIPYLQEYVFVHQQEVRIEQFHRVQENLWTLAVHEGMDSVVELNLTDTRLPLMEVYDRVNAGR
ncbi:MAG: Uma2 family endonuclease [Nodosilinea sp. LVE1205-7]|jgi:Uma2 family endonuclease